MGEAVQRALKWAAGARPTPQWTLCHRPARNAALTWIAHALWQERCPLALSLQSRVQRDDFGGFVEPSMKMLLAAGMARIAHKDGLSNVVITSTDAEVARWLQPGWQVTLDAAGAPTRTQHASRHPTTPFPSNVMSGYRTHTAERKIWVYIFAEIITRLINQVSEKLTLATI